MPHGTVVDLLPAEGESESIGVVCYCSKARIEFESLVDEISVIVKVYNREVSRYTGYKFTYEYTMLLGTHKIEVTVRNPTGGKGRLTPVVGSIEANPPS